MAINWTTIYNKYKGLWIALKQDERTVVASGTSAKSAHSKAVRSGVARPILSFVPHQVTPMVG